MRKLSSNELNRVELGDIQKLQKIPVTVVLDNIRSGLNVGSIFRTCDAFAVEHIILTGFTPQPPHREILKTALGSTESVHWSYCESISECLVELRSKDFRIIAIEQTDKSIELQDANFTNQMKYALILGNEVDGVSVDALEFADSAIEIPQAGIKHSLNVAVCAGMVLWEAFKSLGSVS